MNIEVLLGKCRRLFDECNYLKTVGVCDEILKIDSCNQEALGYKAASLYYLDECDAAMELLEEAISVYPENPHYYHIMAMALMQTEDYEKAIECLEETFGIGISDEDFLKIMESTYETCLRLRVNQLIEREKYVDAWMCYCRMIERESIGLDSSVKLKRFRLHVSQQTSKAKRRLYHVRISSDDAKLKLIRFLNENGFSGDCESGLLISVDVVDKVYSSLSFEEVENVISESKLYDKVNYYPRDMIERKQIFAEDGTLVYEGYTLHNAPYGFGKAYFADGRVYREGIFDIKGIVQGREYYPTGCLRFEGQWCLTGGYGPNAPCDGDAYGEDGKLIYSGKFEIKRGGVGWPRIIKPKGFPLEQKERPKIEYL